MHRQRRRSVRAAERKHTEAPIGVPVLRSRSTPSISSGGLGFEVPGKFADEDCSLPAERTFQGAKNNPQYKLEQVPQTPAGWYAFRYPSFLGLPKCVPQFRTFFMKFYPPTFLTGASIQPYHNFTPQFPGKCLILFGNFTPEKSCKTVVQI